MMKLRIQFVHLKSLVNDFNILDDFQCHTYGYNGWYESGALKNKLNCSIQDTKYFYSCFTYCRNHFAVLPTQIAKYM